MLRRANSALRGAVRFKNNSDPPPVAWPLTYRASAAGLQRRRSQSTNANKTTPLSLELQSRLEAGFQRPRVPFPLSSQRGRGSVDQRTEVAAPAAAGAAESGATDSTAVAPAADAPVQIRCEGLLGWRAAVRHPVRDAALIAASWAVLAAFVFIPTFQILGLILIPLIATLLVRGGRNA